MKARPHVLVLGGGVCGLYAARVLSREHYPVTVLDKGDSPGGLSGGRLHGANFYDLGVHMLHQYDRDLAADIAGIMGGEGIQAPLDARIRWAGAEYRYPLQFIDMLKVMPPVRLTGCVLGLLAAHTAEMARSAPPANAEEALIRLYGRPLYNFFFREFTHKYWGIPPRQLSAAFVREKMPRLTAVDAVKRVLALLGIAERPGRAVDSAMLDETLLYAPTGAEALPRCLAEAVKREGGRLIQGADARAVIIRGGRIVAARYSFDGTDHEIACDACISTIPLPLLAQSAEPAPPPETLDAASRLRFKAIAVYGLLVRRERCMEALYIYFRNRLFHRVGEPKNAGMRVSPPGHTVLIVETTCEVGDEKWRGAPAARDAVAADLETEGICRRSEIAEMHVFPEQFGYPVFALGFEPHLERTLAWVRSIPNLRSAGRQGLFQYPNMHTAMRMGEAAVRAVI